MTPFRQGKKRGREKPGPAPGNARRLPRPSGPLRIKNPPTSPTASRCASGPPSGAPEVFGGTSQALTERGDGRSLSARPPPCRRRREETLSLSLSLPRPSDERSQSLVTSSPTDGNALAERLGLLATSLDLRGLRGLRIRGFHQQHWDAPPATPRCRRF